VAAKYLARADAKVATICGCGNQGRVQLRALAKARAIERIYAFDLDHARAERFTSELSAELSIEALAVRELGPAIRRSDVCVTCMPSRQFFLKREDVSPGTFIAAVSADDERKQELDPHSTSILAAGSRIASDAAAHSWSSSVWPRSAT
jgi:alanine dehydrogenase